MFLRPTFEAMKKFAIVGDGEVAKFHIKNVQLYGKLVAVCSDDEWETDAWIVAQTANAYRSIDEMLKNEGEVEVVIVCSPVGFHAEHVIKSLQAGKDVLCESPLCLTKAAAWQIIETEKYCRRSVYLIQHSRFSQSFIRLKKDLEERPARVSSFHLTCSLYLPQHFYPAGNGKRFPGGGLLYNPFGSLVDLLLFLFGDLVAAEGFLTYQPNRTIEDIEDTGVASLKMQNDVIGTLHWSSVIPEQPMLTILAENGFYQNHLDGPDLLRTHSSKLHPDTVMDINERFYKNVYGDLLKALQGEDVNFPGSFDGARTVEAIEKIYKAVR